MAAKERPAAEDLTNPRGKPDSRDSSLVGLSLSRTLRGTLGSTALASGSLTGGGRAKAERASSSAPSTPGPRIDPNISDRIKQRYAAEVKDLEDKRRLTHVPLAQRETVRPDERSMARTVKGSLDHALKRAGREAVDWDRHTGQEPFQKQLQYLHAHAKTGAFVEHYGGDGRFEGEFLYGMRHGVGRHDFRGEVYEGEWKWDMRHGKGTLALADGSKIKGEWQAGKPHGYAAVVDQHGTTTFEGEFRDGKRHGLGRQLFQSGDMYDGGWCEGRLHDRGVYYFANGDKLYGQWEKGQYEGIGVFHYSDGSVSRRTYREGRLMSVQDFEHRAQRFGKDLRRDGMQRHTADKKFPREIFMLSST